MTVQQLRTAMEAARTGAITQAAKNLYLSQPNASSMLRTLEQELGYEIFSRTNSGIVPTEAGERFLEHAKVILAQLQELYTIRAQGRVCRLRLGVQSFSPAVEAFIRLTPEQKEQAVVIRQAMLQARDEFQAGADASKVKEHAAAMIEGVPDTRIDYLEIVDAETMQPLAENRKPALMAAAVYFGDVRLIDNIEL